MVWFPWYNYFLSDLFSFCIFPPKLFSYLCCLHSTISMCHPAHAELAQTLWHNCPLFCAWKSFPGQECEVESVGPEEFNSSDTLLEKYLAVRLNTDIHQGLMLLGETVVGENTEDERPGWTNHSSCRLQCTSWKTFEIGPAGREVACFNCVKSTVQLVLY